MKPIVKGLLKGLRSIGQEAGEKVVDEAGKAMESVITGKALVGDARPMGQEEMVQAQAEEEKKKLEEMQKLRGGMQQQGRDVEREIEEVRKKKEEEEKKKEEEFLKKLEEQRQAEEQERQALEQQQLIGNPAKRKRRRGSAFVPGKKGGASQASQSSTSEFFKKPD